MFTRAFVGTGEGGECEKCPTNARETALFLPRAPLGDPGPAEAFEHNLRKLQFSNRNFGSKFRLQISSRNSGRAAKPKYVQRRKPKNVQRRNP